MHADTITKLASPGYKSVNGDLSYYGSLAHREADTPSSSQLKTVYQSFAGGAGTRKRHAAAFCTLLFRPTPLPPQHTHLQATILAATPQSASERRNRTRMEVLRGSATMSHIWHPATADHNPAGPGLLTPTPAGRCFFLWYVLFQAPPSAA